MHESINLIACVDCKCCNFFLPICETVFKCCVTEIHLRLWFLDHSLDARPVTTGRTWIAHPKASFSWG